MENDTLRYDKKEWSNANKKSGRESRGETIGLSGEAQGS